MTSTITTPEADSPPADARDALAERLLAGAIAGGEVLSVYLGVELGLYDALAEGPSTATDVASRAGIAERYAREWLEQQAAAGLLTTDAADADADRRLYRLEPAHAEVLTDQDSPY